MSKRLNKEKRIEAAKQYCTFIENHKGITIQDVATEFSVSHSTIQNRITLLKTEYPKMYDKVQKRFPEIFRKRELVVLDDITNKNKKDKLLVYKTSSGLQYFRRYKRKYKTARVKKALKSHPKRNQCFGETYLVYCKNFLSGEMERYTVNAPDPIAAKENFKMVANHYKYGKQLDYSTIEVVPYQETVGAKRYRFSI